MYGCETMDMDILNVQEGGQACSFESAVLMNKQIVPQV